MRSEYSQGSCPPCPEPFNMAGYVLDAGLEVPDKPALIIAEMDQSEVWSYAELRAAILGTATGLKQSGVSAGAKVLMRLGNTVDFPITYLAALACDAVPIPTAPGLTEREIAGAIDLLRPEVIVHDPKVLCPDVSGIIRVDRLRQFRSLPASDIEYGPADRLGYMVFTSGTSGQPRAVCHAHRAIWARRMMFDGWYGLHPTDRVMHAGAFNWTFTLGTGLMDPWTAGATAIIPAEGVPVQALPDILENQKATIFAAAPGVYRKLLNEDIWMDIQSLRHGLSAGEKLSNQIAKAWTARTGTPLLEAYGMSECSTFVSHPPEAAGPVETLGKPQPGRHVAVVQNGAPVPLETEGTIAIHKSDPGLMLGYFGAKSETDNRFHGEWFLTGDQGQMNSNGYIAYLGRTDDMMNAGGFRVSPIEVEQVLAQMPDVEAVAVTDVHVKSDVRVIAAFYTGPSPLDDTAWHAYVTDKLARYKQPRMFIHLPELPVGANGKILRRALRDRFES